MNPQPKHHSQVDIAIAGGGIAGLWLFNLLHRRGYSVVLFEAQQLGCDQTLASQGMIHGGLKYALSGMLTGGSEAIADMPARWRTCLSNPADDDVDLTALTPHSNDYYMFSGGRLGLTSFFASKALRGRINKVSQKERPLALQGLNGVVYKLNDFVLDSQALLTHLAAINQHHLFELELNTDNTKTTADGYEITLDDHVICAQRLISCAGNGSQTLLEALKISGFKIQQRPLKQVMVQPQHQHSLFAHCLTAVTTNEPRLTITTHADAEKNVWYLGGKIASSGVQRSDEEQIKFAQQELEHCLGWLDWQNAHYDVLWVNRAEPAQRGGLKPDQAYAEQQGNFILTFPTKLTLAPNLGDQVLDLLPAPKHGNTRIRSNHKKADMGNAPWQLK